MGNKIEICGRILVSALLLHFALEFTISVADWILWGLVFLGLAVWIWNPFEKMLKDANGGKGE